MASSVNPNRVDVDDDETMQDGDECQLSDEELQTPEPTGKSTKRKGKEKVTGDCSGGQKKTRSEVWDYFTKQKNHMKCNCNYCGKEMSALTKSGTSSLKKHIENTCKAYRAWKAANKDKNQAMIIPEGAAGNLKLLKVSDDVIRDATEEMMVLAEMPLCFIESVAWKHFCSRVQLPKPHSRRTATRDIVLMYVNKKAAMKMILGKNKQRVSLTTDIWVAPVTGASYMVITAHFVDTTWELRKMIIGFKNSSDHKGETICKVLLKCLAEWDIKRVFCITVDNATANSSAMTKFKEAMNASGDDALVLKGEYMHCRCATHILNLVVKEGLQELAHSVASVRNGIQYVRSTPNRLKSFDFRVDTVKIKRGSLPLDIKTRWNSTYLMLEQAIKFRVAFQRMADEDIPYGQYFMEKIDGTKRIGPAVEEDWDEIDRLVQILVIFYKSTLVLSASTRVASHKLYNEIVTITTNLSALSSITGPDQKLKRRAMAMLGKLGKYWDLFGTKVEMNKLVIVATVFDPRKKIKFVDMCFETLYGKDSVESSHLSSSIKDILNDLYDEYSRAAI